MNRRALFGMILGTLAIGPFASIAHAYETKETPTPAKTPIAELFVSTSADVDQAFSVGPVVSIGSVIIRSDAEADTFLARLAQTIANAAN